MSDGRVKHVFKLEYVKLQKSEKQLLSLQKIRETRCLDVGVFSSVANVIW